MCAFSVIDKVPGVYIDEVQVAGAIAGVSTSTLGIVGPAQKGPINTPTLVTNPTQFTQTFGGHLPSPPFYTSHAVLGFFANGGASCYFVRAATAVRSSLTLLDRSGGGGNATIVVTALEEGTGGDQISVQVQDAGIVAPADNVVAVKAEANGVAQANAGDNELEVGDASGFRAGDVVLVSGGGGGADETHTVFRVSGNTVRLTAPLAAARAVGATIRIADLANAFVRLRVSDHTGIEPGSVVRISQQGGASVDRIVNAVESTDHVLTLAQPLGGAFGMAAADQAVVIETLEFTLLVTHAAQPADTPFENLAMDPRHSRYFAKVVNPLSKYVEVAPADPPNVTPAPNDRPAVLAASPLQGGQDDNPGGILDGGYTAGIDELERIDAVSLVCCPDRINSNVQGYLIAHCQKMQDRFAILDPERDAGPANGIRTQRSGLTSPRGYAALYYPWIRINGPGDSPLLVPPSGHVAGVFARTDGQKGVHKAPANEPFNGVIDLQRTLNDTEAGQLNELGINVLRRIPNRGFRIWGARTLATSTQWRYVNVRRLVLFVEESIQEGTQDAVFEPNNPALWQTVKRQVTDFLTRVWSNGALFGNTPAEAFQVRVDEELNPPAQIALGVLTIEVKLRPTTPAEFIVFRIIADPSRAIVEE